MKIVCSIVCMLMMLFGAWIAGYDFNERGLEAAFIYIVTILFGAWGYVLGLIITEERF